MPGPLLNNLQLSVTASVIGPDGALRPSLPNEQPSISPSPDYAAEFEKMRIMTDIGSGDGLVESAGDGVAPPAPSEQFLPVGEQMGPLED